MIDMLIVYSKTASLQLEKVGVVCNNTSAGLKFFKGLIHAAPKKIVT